jgi:hypothetical protein
MLSPSPAPYWGRLPKDYQEYSHCLFTSGTWAGLLKILLFAWGMLNLFLLVIDISMINLVFEVLLLG